MSSPSVCTTSEVGVVTRPSKGICVISTPLGVDSDIVEFVLPYPTPGYRFDEDLSNRSGYFPQEYLFSVKIYTDQYLHVKGSCRNGSCSCLYLLDGVPSPLKPCRFACLMWDMKMFSSEDLFVLNGVCKGFKIVDDDVNLSYSLHNYKSILDSSMYSQMCDVIAKELANGQVSRLSEPAKCVHALGAVVRPNGKLRPITDCSRPILSVNDFMNDTAQKFKFSHIEDTRSLVSVNGFGGTIDLSNAYRSVLIFPPHRSFVGFNWSYGNNTMFFCDNALCFGLKSAPSIFNSISQFITRYMVLSNAPCLSYLDDYFVAGPDFETCKSRQEAVLNCLTYVGFTVNYDKVAWPTHTPKFLGVIVDLVQMRFRLPSEKMEKTLLAVNSALQSVWISRKSLERLTGLLAHCATLVRGGRTFIRRLYCLLKASTGKKRVRLSEIYKGDLKWWSSFLKVFDGQCDIFPPSTPSHHVFTDASGSGFGAWYLRDYLFGFWADNSFGCHHLSSPPTFDDLSLSNINIKELWPVLAAIHRWGNQWRNSYVLLHTDNTQVLAMVSSGRSKNSQAMQLLRELFWCCAVLKIDLRASYISTDTNLFADKLSRLSSSPEKCNTFGLPVTFVNCCLRRDP